MTADATSGPDGATHCEDRLYYNFPYVTYDAFDTGFSTMILDPNTQMLKYFMAVSVQGGVLSTQRQARLSLPVMVRKALDRLALLAAPRRGFLPAVGGAARTG